MTDHTQLIAWYQTMHDHGTVELHSQSTPMADCVNNDCQLAAALTDVIAENELRRAYIQDRLRNKQ